MTFCVEQPIFSPYPTQKTPKGFETTHLKSCFGNGLRCSPLIAPRFLDAFTLRFLLPFEVDGQQHPVPHVLAFGIVEHLDVIEHVLSGFPADPVCLAPDPLPLEQI
ncbi:MAG: hypothetical protein ACJAW4_003613 [Paracoccaceae bacterium]|jgi:hypothetical protein